MPRSKAGADPGAKEALTIDHKSQTADPPSTAIDLATALDVRREMCRVYRSMKSKQLDPSDGTKLIYALTAIGKMIEVHEFERRIDVLEQRSSVGGALPTSAPARPH